MIQLKIWAVSTNSVSLWEFKIFCHWRSPRSEMSLNLVNMCGLPGLSGGKADSEAQLWVSVSLLSKYRDDPAQNCSCENKQCQSVGIQNFLPLTVHQKWNFTESGQYVLLRRSFRGQNWLRSTSLSVSLLTKQMPCWSSPNFELWAQTVSACENSKLFATGGPPKVKFS